MEDTDLMVCLSISLNLPLSISVSQYVLDLSSYLILTEGSSLYLRISIPACTFRLPMPVAVGSKSGKDWWWPAVRILSPLYRKRFFFFLLPFLCIATNIYIYVFIFLVASLFLFYFNHYTHTHTQRLSNSVKVVKQYNLSLFNLYVAEF